MYNKAGHEPEIFKNKNYQISAKIWKTDKKAFSLCILFQNII